MTRDVLIFANPIAGRGQGRIIAERLAARLASESLNPRLILERADQVPDDRLPGDARAAIAIGGDGTVRGVARRLFAAHGGEMPPLLVVPMGTANLLGRHLGIRQGNNLPEEVSALLRVRQISRLDAATANGDLFLLMAGIGMDGRVVHELDRIRTGPIDITSYALPAALALGFYTYPPLTVYVDDRAVAKNLPAVAFIGNVKEYGTGFPILPDARPDDGLLDVCILPCSNRREAIHHLLRAAAGEHLLEEGVIYTKGKRVLIDSPQPVPVQVDGEAAGHTPLIVNLLPVRLPFIVPGAV